jgi:hypothetical protein
VTTLAWVLAAMALLAPERDHAELGGAIARVVEAEAPLFRDDEDRKRTAALVIAVAFREGSLGLHVEGDRRAGKPTSWCSLQINLSPGMRTREGWTGEDLRDDAVKCVTVGMRLLRDSLRACPRVPLGVYAVGPLGCSDARAARISRDRVALAARLLREVQP